MNETERLLTRGEVERRTGMGRSVIYRAMREQRFPEPLRVGPKSVRWRLSEVQQWIDSLERSHGDGKRGARREPAQGTQHPPVQGVGLHGRNRASGNGARVLQSALQPHEAERRPCHPKHARLPHSPTLHGRRLHGPTGGPWAVRSALGAVEAGERRAVALAAILDARRGCASARSPGGTVGRRGRSVSVGPRVSP